MDGADGTGPAVWSRLRSTVAGLLTVSSVPSAKLWRLLSQLSGEIRELERLVAGEAGREEGGDFTAALESSREGPMPEIRSPFGGESVRTLPEASTEWGALAYLHVRQARMALEDGDKVTFWREFYAARRMELFGLEGLGGEYLEMQAQSIKLEAAGLAARNGLLRLDPPRKEAIQNILGDVGNYGEQAPATEQAGRLTADRVGAAMHVLHEFYVDQRLTGRILEIHLRSFIVIMAVSAITFIVAFLSIPLREGEGLVDRIELLQSPVSGLVGLPTFAQLIVLVLIVVLGIMGASVSGILSLSRELRESRIPEQAGTVWFAIARLATGGVAALMLFLFLLSGVVSLDGDATTGILTLNLGTTLSVALVFSLSFVAGFSERLLVRVVKSVAGEDGDVTRGDGTWY
ncbi:hypothetical protein DU484_11010 [Haloplanus rubicundus]|uniref:Uncharacterized protein n=1 Tax=Haloplanus rubicundus TaxID=1547898 RepID=A0A345EDQ8_9EURY|nr:hypothetical protein DU484_11010 [Haloplanus rubicundus]